MSKDDDDAAAAATAADDDAERKSRREDVAVLLVDAEFMDRLKAKTDPQAKTAAALNRRPKAGKRMLIQVSRYDGY
jgi:hypothetical protein